MCCGFPAERKHSTKSAPKSTKNVSGGTRAQPRARWKQQVDVLSDFLSKNDLTDTMILTHFGPKIGENRDRKNGQKTAPIQNYFFRRFFGFSGVARTILINLGSQNDSQEGPGATFSRAFPAIGFQHDLGNSCGAKKRRKIETTQILENHRFPEEKQRFSKNRRFSKDGPRGPKMTSKSEENCPNMLQKTSGGLETYGRRGCSTHFFTKKVNF